MTRFAQIAVVPSPSPLAVRTHGGLGAFKTRCEMKLPLMDPGLRELVALAVLAALGCGLAAAQGDLLFVAIFGAAVAMTIIEAIRRKS
jgi:alkylhydroperoxidase/carboxymuconolactone decarboxylase family protein YurZ